ncbi:DNA-processing protein DprA [Mycoplasmopsis columbinasalis]|uniref:DNA processing protein n=1 Tax=Mycoplasmopsis columbinasalis TaxID=114880 RepID=A0A449BA47_9BACT|nr:DNA-processing protein DprA [Mycoplasmopsis columbinasalis]VEU78070.1 DNA processing protein [Mycoplasmopsis columbinasalis]
MNNLILYFTYKYNGNPSQVHKAIKASEPIEKDVVLNYMLLELDIHNVKFLTILDDNFPPELQKYANAPLLLFYRGNIELLNKPKITLTADLATDLTNANIKDSIQKLAKEFVLVTTNFKTLDQQIIQEWKKQNGDIIYTYAYGLAHETNDQLDEHTLQISTYPPNAHPKLSRFRERNILVSWLSKFLIIYSSKKDSGILNLASCFNDAGKEVFCYPGVDYDDGNTQLLKSGAHLITHIADIAYI